MIWIADCLVALVAGLRPFTIPAALILRCSMHSSYISPAMASAQA
jgi:hypothetical protein